MYSVEGRFTDMDFFLVGRAHTKFYYIDSIGGTILHFWSHAYTLLMKPPLYPKVWKLSLHFSNYNKYKKAFQYCPLAIRVIPGPISGGGKASTPLPKYSPMSGARRVITPPPRHTPRRGLVPEIPTPKKIWDQRYPPSPLLNSTDWQTSVKTLPSRNYLKNFTPASFSLGQGPYYYHALNVNPESKM